MLRGGFVLYLGATTMPFWLLVLLPAFVGPGFAWTFDVVGGDGGRGGVGRWFLAVCQRVINALHSARVSRETLVAS